MSLMALISGQNNWLTKGRSLARLKREHALFTVIFEDLEKNWGDPEASWIKNGRAYLKLSLDFHEEKDVNGGWTFLQAAQREALYGRSEEEREHLRVVLLREKAKLRPWRVEALEDLLKGPDKVTISKLVLAAWVRDEDISNRYHTVELAGDQLGILTRTCGVATLFLLPLPIFSWRYAHGTPPAWGFTMLCAVLVFGLFGGAFAVAQTLFDASSSVTIPSQVRNHWVVLMRAFFGAVAGLAGYAFWRSHLISLNVPNVDETAVGISFAFLFGYAGERLVGAVGRKVGGASETEKAK